jgi:outer membrane cobalamin receptor
LGADYRIDKNLAVFAHYSSGASFNVIERMGGPYDGTAPIPLNTVKQFEGGVKWRTGGFSTFVTLFNAKTAESNFDVTIDQLTSNTYNANGVEFESAYRVGGFSISGGFTYVDASITSTNETEADGSSVNGNQPKRLARYTYQVTPTYSMDNWTIGGSIVGTGKSFGDDQNTIVLPAFYSVNLFANVQLSQHTTAWLSANNLFNTVGWTEYDAGQGARSINGRTAKVGLKYTF